NSITVTRATDASGVPVTTAGDVVAAVNADPSASALVTAQTYRGDAGSGTVATTGSPVHLSDFLFAPTRGHVEVDRAPFQSSVLRICHVCDGSRVGVLLYAGLQAASWVAPPAALETATRLLHNYGTDPTTTALVNDLDIFVLPVANPDG